jgi:hypothetical protein
MPARRCASRAATVRACASVTARTAIVCASTRQRPTRCASTRTRHSGAGVGPRERCSVLGITHSPAGRSGLSPQVAVHLAFGAAAEALEAQTPRQRWPAAAAVSCLLGRRALPSPPRGRTSDAGACQSRARAPLTRGDVRRSTSSMCPARPLARQPTPARARRSSPAQPRAGPVTRLAVGAEQR